jgi:hypothetical protein
MSNSTGRLKGGARSIFLILSFVVVVVVVPISGCKASFPSSSVEDNCRVACAAKAPGCTADECARGCNFIIDRIIEHEGDSVLACMGKVHPPCNDTRWATCATNVGAHADGGPPAPPPPKDIEDEEN